MLQGLYSPSLTLSAFVETLLSRSLFSPLLVLNRYMSLGPVFGVSTFASFRSSLVSLVIYRFRFSTGDILGIASRSSILSFSVGVRPNFSSALSDR